MERLYKKLRYYFMGTQRKIDFSHRFRSGSRIIRKHRFEGVIPSLKRRFKETDSEYIRNELKTYVRERVEMNDKDLD